MEFPQPEPALLRVDGRGPIVFVAPHAVAPADAAAPFVLASPADLLAHIDEWHDVGSAEALDAACKRLGAPGLRPRLPRGLLDLNRGWKGRVEAAETLFGKGALDAWSTSRLRPGAQVALEGWYRAAIAEIRTACEGAAALVELHSYGDLGSTHDRLAGGRAVRRSEAAIVTSTPWATAYPLGVARLIPSSLRGCRWPLERRVGDGLAEVGLQLGPQPYPALAPWTLSLRFLAARWFTWLADTGRLPPDTAHRLVDRAWVDEQDPTIDAIATGQHDEGDDWRGVAALGQAMGAWGHAPGDLAERFLDETGVVQLVVELRLDKVELASGFGGAVADAVA